MTTTTVEPRTVPDIAPHEPGDEPTYGQLCEVMANFEKATASFNVFADKPGDCEAIWQLVLRWLPLAEKRLGEADGSPTDQARWKELIAGVQRPTADATTAPDVGALIHNAWQLFGALVAAARSGPSVREIADYIRESITTGIYSPGILLSVGRVAAEVNCPLASIGRVRLAARDMEAEGVITYSPSDRIRVAMREEAADRPAQIASWLSVLIQAGVYPPESKLPALADLARALVSPPAFVSRALHLLHETGVVTHHRGLRTVIRPALPFDVLSPPDVHSLLPMLWNVALPDVDLSHTGIREMCHRTSTWWRSRLTPHPETLDHTLRALAAAAEYLLPLVAHQHPDNAEVHATLRRTAVTALAVRPSTSEARVWRTACLGASVLEALHLAGDAV